jgi:predicted CXXCH cytochrome family protein
MRARSGIVLGLWVVLAAGESTADPGICVECHATQLAAGGHAANLDCVICHEDRRPGTVGRRHRTIPTSCTSHHAVETHPRVGGRVRAARVQRSCLKCHDAHGSENVHLIRTMIRTRGRLFRVDFRDPAAFIDPARPGHGLCEVCHTTTKFYRANGRGESHFTGDCTLCHDHGDAFAPVATDANCAVCHPDETARLAKPTRHNAKFAGTCSSCHAEVSPEPGAGHRATTSCEDCHAPTRVTTHVPPGVRIPCTQCHDAHGSDNIRLVRDVIQTIVPAVARPIDFTNLAGRADGSFASTSAPGTGLCEVCHTGTAFYRGDGGGALHYGTSCVVCHPHAAGFAPH